MRDVPSFPISACMLLHRGTSSDVQGDLLRSRGLNNFSLFFCACLLPACNKGLDMGKEEREGFIISDSQGDMNFPFWLSACQFGPT